MSYELREARHGDSRDGARPVSTFQLSKLASGGLQAESELNNLRIFAKKQRQ
jgi:hypothetical protein